MPSSVNQLSRIAVILAGGRSRRMGAVDKAIVVLRHRRLIDHVVARLAPQVDRILISGNSSYDTGHTLVPDREDGPLGPASGLWAIARWLGAQQPDATGFLSVPVDGPFLPEDLFQELASEGACTVASDESGAQPTFAFWHIATLTAALEKVPEGRGVSLQALAAQCQAKRIKFPRSQLMNVNSQEDLSRAEEILKTTSE